MNTLKITDTIILNNRIEIHFEPDENLNPFFPERVFWLEYTENMEAVPPGIAIIPFVCNVLPIVWITDSTLIVDEIDEDFYHSIPHIRQGYANMYRKVDFKGTVAPAKIVKHRVETDVRRSLAFFSGGVDAHCTLLSHLDESPDLLTVWGADIAIGNEAGWQKVHEHMAATASEFNLGHVEVKSNFRTFINPSRFRRHEKTKWDYDYWHRLQHGIGLIGHAAPYAFVKKIDTIYFASSFSPKERKRPDHACASDPTIDEQLAFFVARVIHDMADLSRQDKIDRIVSSSRNENKKIYLRVCWQSDGGENCSGCEKCYRTILGLLVAGADPNDYGFQVDRHKLLEIEYRSQHKIPWNNIRILLWNEIKTKYSPDVILPQYRPYMRWFGNLKIKKRVSRVEQKLNSVKYRIRKIFH